MPALRVLVTILLLCSTAKAEDITVSAAISLKDALTDIQKPYETASADRLQFIFGASGQLLAQIKNGAPVAVFISAADKQVDDLLKAGLADRASRRVIAGNSLVLIVPAEAKSPVSGFKDLANPSVQRIAIGEPKTVPAGAYAMQVLEHLRLTGPLGDRLVYGSNVRQVLDYVERGEVSAGLVYSTDAREAGTKVRVVATADPASHEPIEYPAVIVSTSNKREAAKRFLDYLRTDKARTVLRSCGFASPAGEKWDEEQPTSGPASRIAP